MRLLVFAAVAAPVLAIWPIGQDPDEDWQKHVEKACESRRYGIRLAAARKVAEGGDAAVPAIRAYMKDKGRDAIPDVLVDIVADADARDQAAVTALLRDWATDRDFFWRGQAMRGLALRAAAAAPDGDDRAALRELFVQNADDAAWLTRTHARFGLALTAPTDADRAAVLARPEPDPRAPVRLSRLLLEQGAAAPLQPLLDALADERTFLGTPWGPRLGQEAAKALRDWLGDDCPEFDPDDKAGSIAKLRDAAQARSGQALEVPSPQRDPDAAVAGGIEVLSCKNGDFFARWDDGGRLLLGIDGGRTVEIPDDAWRTLWQKRTGLAIDSAGEVVCDSLRLRLDDPETHAKVAPGALPAAATEWLKLLAARLEEQGERDVAADVRRSLGQFAGG